MNRWIGAFAVLIVLCCFARTGYAQCTPGIPCPNDYTPGQGVNDSKTGGSEACDGDFMNMIYARATLEAQREKMMSQTFIVKPDSVLEYSCFGEFANVLAEKAPPIFSESEFWNNKTVKTSVTGKPQDKYPAQRTLKVHMDKGHITPGLEGVVMQAFRDYIGTGQNGNFPHQYLGGTAGYDPGITGTAAPKGSANCARMQQVWKLARCKNFDADTFKSFKEFINNDPRSGAMQACNNPEISQRLIDMAQNPAPEYPTYGQLSGAYRYATFDGIRHPIPNTPLGYSDPMLLKPKATTGTSSCAPPVRTGLIAYIELSSSDVASNSVETVKQTYSEAICPNPDCYYVVSEGGGNPEGSSGSTLGRCVQIGGSGG